MFRSLFIYILSLVFIVLSVQKVDATDKDELYNAASLIVYEVHDRKNLDILSSFSEEIPAIASYIDWAQGYSVDHLRAISIGAIDGLTDFAIRRYGEISEEAIFLRLCGLNIKANVEDVSAEYGRLLNDAETMVAQEKSRDARAVRLLVALYHFENHYPAEWDYSPSAYVDLHNLEAEALELFPADSDEASILRLYTYSILAGLASFPTIHATDFSLAMQLAGIDLSAENGTSYNSVGEGGESKNSFTNHLWYLNRVDEIASTLYPEDDIRAILAKVQSINGYMRIGGISKESIDDLSLYLDKIRFYYPSSSPNAFNAQILQWNYDIAGGNEPANTARIGIIEDYIKNNFGNGAEFVLSYQNFAFPATLLNPLDNKYLERLSQYADECYGKDSVKSLLIQLEALTNCSIVNSKYYAPLIDKIRDKFIVSYSDNEQWLELAYRLTKFYSENAGNFEVASNIQRIRAEIIANVRGEFSPYHCQELLGIAELSSQFKDKEIFINDIDKYFDAVEKTSPSLRPSFYRYGYYRVAYTKLFGEDKDYRSALRNIDKALSYLEKELRSEAYDLLSMKALALLYLGENDSSSDNEVKRILDTFRQQDPFSRDLYTILNCATYLQLNGNPTDALAAIDLGLETNHDLNNGFSDAYSQLRRLSIDAYSSMGDMNSARRIIAEDMIEMDNWLFENNSIGLLEHLEYAAEVSLNDGSNPIERTAYLMKMWNILNNVVASADDDNKDHLLMNYGLRILYHFLNGMVDCKYDLDSFTDEDIARFPDTPEGLAAKKFASQWKDNLLQIFSSSQLEELTERFDQLKYYNSVIPYLCAAANFIFNVYNEPDKAEALLLKALNLAEQADDSLYYASTSSYLFSFYEATGRHDPAMHYFKFYEDEIRSNPSSNLRNLKDVNITAIDECISKQDYPTAIRYARDYTDRVRQYINGSYRLMTSADQEAFMERIGDPAFFLNRLLDYCPDSISGDAYNAILFRTGLQLKSQQATRLAIDEGSDEVKDLARRIDNLNRQITHFKANFEEGQFGPVTTNKDELIRQQREKNRLEQILMDLTAESRADITSSADWQSVCRSLRPGEAAIEITGSHSGPTALILKPGVSAPIVVKLCEGSDLDNVISPIFAIHDSHSRTKALYDDPQSPLYRLLWEPLSAHLDGIQNIFLAGSGVNMISFDAIQTPDGARLFDKYHIYRLTSTANIAETRSQSYPASALLVGDIHYSESQRLIYGDERGTGERASDFDHFTYLEYAAKEIEDVERILSPISPLSLRTTDATEQQLRKSIADKAPDILHLATHGYYIADVNAAYDIPYMQRNSQTIGYAMNRAGIALDGAEATWQGAELEADNDGIMTATEMSQLNLKGAQLVALSACETALGSTSFEGVYGLQRALKIAGAKSLLLSLWTVNDLSTSDFMIDFYRNWLATGDKYESYRQAVASNRAKYRSSYFWAPFVLLD